jgi:hypothetical protein
MPLTKGLDGVSWCALGPPASEGCGGSVFRGNSAMPVLLVVDVGCAEHAEHAEHKMSATTTQLANDRTAKHCAVTTWGAMGSGSVSGVMRLRLRIQWLVIRSEVEPKAEEGGDAERR